MSYVSTSYTWENRDLVDRNGARIGRIEAVFGDAVSGRINWALARHHHRKMLVPLRDARPRGERVSVRVDRASARRAPRMTVTHTIGDEQEAALLLHYGMTV